MYRVYVLFTCCLLVLVGCTKDRDTTAPTSTVDTVYVVPPPQVERKDFAVDHNNCNDLIDCNASFADQFCIGLGYDKAYTYSCFHDCGIVWSNPGWLGIVTCERTR